MTSLMGLWTKMRARLEWVRQHNRSAASPVGFYADQNPLDAIDVLVLLPYVTAAKPHQAALARSSLDIQEAFARWTPP